MSIQNLLTGLNQFTQGIQRLQQGRIINKANEAVQQIRQSEADDTQKRAELQQLSQQVALGLMQWGGTPQASAFASQLIRPAEQEKPSSPQSLVQGLLSDDPEMRSRAQQIQEQQIEMEARAKERAEASQIKREEARFNKKEKIRAQQRTIPGLGIATTKSTAERLKKEVPQTISAIQGVEDLKSFKRLDKLDPNQKARAKQIATVLRGVSRLSLIGPGAVSDEERKHLNEAIPNPTDVLQVFSDARLDELSNLMKRNARNQLELSLEDIDQESELVNLIYGEPTAPQPTAPQTPAGAGFDFRKFRKK